MPEPDFSQQQEKSGKCVQSKVLEQMGYQFKVDNLIGYFNEQFHVEYRHDD